MRVVGKGGKGTFIIAKQRGTGAASHRDLLSLSARTRTSRLGSGQNHTMRMLMIYLYLTGVHLTGVYLMDVYMFPNPKRLWRNLQISHLTNGCRFVEI